VRAYGTDGVRVSIGTPDENDTFLAVARTFLRPRQARKATARPAPQPVAKPAKAAAAVKATPAPRRARRG
jgi:hypothetical protein